MTSNREYQTSRVEFAQRRPTSAGSSIISAAVSTTSFTNQQPPPHRRLLALTNAIPCACLRKHLVSISISLRAQPGSPYG